MMRPFSNILRIHALLARSFETPTPRVASVDPRQDAILVPHHETAAKRTPIEAAAQHPASLDAD
ncbi:MAG: hypothetical protein M0015_10060 [Betaproteobacteria bacterium]|nr:hypothetical protein [Betaproteobacteria bacterium]